MDGILEKYLPPAALEFVEHLIYGSIPSRVELPDAVLSASVSLDVELQAFSLLRLPAADASPSGSGKVVRIGLCQMQLPASTTEHVLYQKAAAIETGLKFLELAHASGVQIVCFQELWTMPMGFCTGKKLPWVEFAEDAIYGETTKTLQNLAKVYEMVIVSPILERDKDDLLWNTAVVIDADGQVLGTYRKVHIPISGNENTFFQPSNDGVPVFQTRYGRVGVSICYDRHHPPNWYAHRLQTADIVFSPCASVQSFGEHLWGVEGRAAAAANGYFVASVNRVGLEIFLDENGEEKKQRLFYGSSYAASPNGTRTPGLSPDRDGLLVVDIDFQECRKFPDKAIHEAESVEVIRRLFSRRPKRLTDK